jgi:hypothetical protein
MATRARPVTERIDRTLSKRPPALKPVPDIERPAVDLGKILQRTTLAPNSLRPAELLDLQRTLGNRAVGVLLARSAASAPQIQAKLTVNAPGDEYEREADWVAEQVMRMPAVQREVLDEDEETAIMTKRLSLAASGAASEADPEFEQQLNASRGRGEPLPKDLREEFEGKFGADFSGVRIHRDAEADELNRSIQARAFTNRQDVFYRQGAYEPGSLSGQALIAHELTHVLQQRGGLEGRAVQRPPEIQAGRHGRGNTQQQKGIQGNKQPEKQGGQPGTKKSGKTQEQTKGEAKELDIRARLIGVGPASDASDLPYGVMDVIAGSSLNGTGGVVIVDLGGLKATDEQKNVVIDLLKNAHVQAGSATSTPWHKNEHGKLPRKQGKTPYLEFLIPGYKSKNLIERAVYDTQGRIVYLTCHYDTGSFVRLNGLPEDVKMELDRKAAEAKEWFPEQEEQ